jgi:twitching motility protein PilT
VARVRGELITLGEALPAAQLEHIVLGLGSAEARELLAARGSADLSTTVGGLRCRINLYRTARGTALAARLLVPTPGGLHATNLHPDLRHLIDARTGLVLVSGPTGSGKSTTLAALVEEVNASLARHIITLESPLEHLFSPGRSFIRQREIPTHSPSFVQAITDALRENPDILVISEMRTPEVMRLTLDAAETGHLVLATLHASTCVEALSRICMSFPAEAQQSIRAQLADCLVGVVSQRLDYFEAQQLRVPRCEILTASTPAKSTIRAGQLGHLTNVIQTGGADGMWTFERYHRWMEQKEDWVRHPPGHEPVAPELAEPPAPPTLQPPPTSGRPAAPPPAAALPVPGAPPFDGAIEISIDLDDEQDLAALIRQVERRSR